MTLKQGALAGQIVWFLTACSYNGLSLLAIANGDMGFAGDAATTRSAMGAVMIFGAVTLTGILGKWTIYKILAPLVIIALFVGGVLKHMYLGPADYASETYWVSAITINAFGVMAYAIGWFSALRKS